MKFQIMQKLTLCAVILSSTLCTACGSSQTTESNQAQEGTEVSAEHQTSEVIVADTKNQSGNDNQSVRTVFVPTDENTYISTIDDECSVIEDVVYDETNQLKLDIYQAKNTTANKDEKHPAVLLFHGGGYVKGDKKTDELTKSIAMDLARMGYVTCNVNYTISEKYSMNAIMSACEDGVTAIKWLQEHSEAYGIDPHQIAIGGYSAGGGLAANVVYSHQKAYDFAHEDIFAVIDIAGGDLSFGKPEATDPACLILQGNADTTQDIRESRKLEKKLNKVGVPVNFHEMDGLNHTFTTRYEEVITQIAEHLYENLTGVSQKAELTIDTNPEWINVETRMDNGVVFEVPQVNVTLDGDLTEWANVPKMELKYAKDAGEDTVDPDNFSGYAQVAWSEKEPGIIYIAACITDDEIKETKGKDVPWYNNDCLEIIFDLSANRTAEQYMKWVVSAGEQKLSVLATEENTRTAVTRNGNQTCYEIAIDINKVDTSVRINKDPIVIEEGTQIGFMICYNDCEKKGRQRQMGFTPGKTSDRTTFGNLIFTK